MPDKAKRFCKQVGCSQLVTSGYCQQHQKNYNRAKRNRNEWSGWYSTPKWRTARMMYLSCNPLCVECERQGRLTPATVVDHIISHKGNTDIFWNTDNWQALCKRCHDIKTAREDAFGRG